MVVERSKALETDSDPAALNEQRLVVRHYTVFHASQIDGIPGLETPEATEASRDPDPRVTDIIQNLGVTLVVGGSQAYFRPTRDEIHIPTLGSFASAADYDTVLLHEIGHSTGHEKRLNRRGIIPSAPQTMPRKSCVPRSLQR